MLDHMARARVLADDTEEAVYKRGGTFDEVLEQFHEQYYSWLDPAGIAERLEQNKIFEEELLDFEVNLLGHTLINNVEQYQRRIEKAPTDMYSHLSALVQFVSPSFIAQKMVVEAEYKSLYNSYDAEAFAWQDSLSDEQLLTTLRALRRYISVTEYLCVESLAEDDAQESSGDPNTDAAHSSSVNVSNLASASDRDVAVKSAAHQSTQESAHSGIAVSGIDPNTTNRKASQRRKGRKKQYMDASI